SAEVAVAPQWRRHGLGRRLLDELWAHADARGLRVWAHGDLAPARALAASAGLQRMRALWKMRLPLRGTDSAPAATLPEPALRPEVARQVEIRTCRVGVDEQEWLRTNARAFADHPEQGALTLEDLQQREQEPWRSEERRVGKGSRRRQRQPLYSV